MPILRIHAAYICGRPAERMFVTATVGRLVSGAYTDTQGCVRLVVPEQSVVGLEIDGCPCTALVRIGTASRRLYARVGSPVIALLDVSSAAGILGPPLEPECAPIWRRLHVHSEASAPGGTDEGLDRGREPAFALCSSPTTR